MCATCSQPLRARMNTDDEGCYYRAKWKIGRKELNSVVWAAERWGRYSIMFFIHPTSLRHLHIMYMRSLPRNQNFQKCGKCNFVLFFYSFYSRNFVLHLPHLLQVEKHKWAIYQRCMRARWRRRWWKFHQLLKLIKVSDRSETFFQFIIIIIIFIIIVIIIYVIIRPE